MLIADLRLPDGVFLDLAREREGKFPSPFIVVSVIHDANILRECYQFGARDILTKPFVGAELLVKIERILAAETTSRSLTLCSKKKTATHRGTTVDLTQREFQILRSFDRAPSRQINRTSIIHSIWGSEKISPKNFDVHLVHLRRKLKELGIEIKMVEPGVYRLSETP
jgi:DNA-binding response OmpR family regulator